MIMVEDGEYLAKYGLKRLVFKKNEIWFFYIFNDLL